MSFLFEPSRHRYEIDGAEVPSVTTIINEGVPKPALPYWAAKRVAEAAADHASTYDELRRVGRGAFIEALKKAPWDARDKAADRGTDIHAYAERIVKGELMTVPDELWDSVSHLAAWFDDFDYRPILTETYVGSRTHGYAGRFDFLGSLGGETWLIDLKTSRGVYGETALQTAAYARADFVIDANGVEAPVPHVDRIGVLHVTESGAALYDLGDIDAAFTEFLAALVIAGSNKRRAALVRQPIRNIGALTR